MRIDRGLALSTVRDRSLRRVRMGRRLLIPRRQIEALFEGAAPRP